MLNLEVFREIYLIFAMEGKNCAQFFLSNPSDNHTDSPEEILTINNRTDKIFMTQHINYI